MGIVFRQSIKATIVNSVGAVLGALSVFISPFILQKTELGFFTNIIYTGALLQIFVMVGTGNMLSIYLQKYDVTDVRRKVLMAFAFLTTLIATLVFTLFFALLKTKIIALYQPSDQQYVRQYYYWVPVLVFLWSLMTLFELYLIAHIKIAVSAFSREVLLRICNLILLGLVFFKLLSFHIYLVCSILIYAVPVLVLFFAARRTEGFGFSSNWKVFSKQEYKSIINFSWYHLLFVVSVNLLGILDTLMLAPLDTNGMQATAVYSRGVFIAALMVIPYRAMSSSSLPVLNRAYIDNDIPKLNDLFSRAGVNILVVGIGLFIVIGSNLNNAVTILPKGYEAIKPVALILMLGKIVDMATGLNNELISISKYYKFNFRISFLLVLMVIIFNRILIPEYGMFGAAWGVTIALAIFNIIKLIFLWKKMRLHPFTIGSAWVLVSGAVAGLAGYLLPYLSGPVIDTIIRTAVTAIIYALMLILLKPSPDIKAYLETVVAKKRLF